MMTVNCYPISLLTKCLLESSFKRRFAKGNKKSLIINNCAGASIAPMPYVQLYAATKMYCDFITEGLIYELKEFGIDVMGIRSFGIADDDYVPTSMYKKLMNVKARDCIEASLGKCTSGLDFGALQHEVLGTLMTNIMDMLPLESRQFITEKMGRKTIEDKKGVKF